ncbi:uncharacterized protein LOC116202554 [Punica granatum]|uniref:Uncharacterized protein LOC116202554 n=2 Tax=Punica granatum TaxID=22663 RepID=A0A6P8D0W7_PUNGR|nr:uncharacterized protein LOC116202554 [Punica granatum]PKI45664.1 hypothetical protein CRG98_033980 [Punica granatum]
MGWLIKEKRGPAWKHGWTENTLTSVSPPPLPVITIFFIVVLLLYLSFSINYNKQMQRTVVGMKLFLFLLPVLLIFAAQFVSVNGGVSMPYQRPRPGIDSVQRDGRSSSWGVAILVLLMLVLLSFQSSFHSKWSPWGSSYAS